MASPFFYALFFSFFALFSFPCIVTSQKPSPINNGDTKKCQSFLIYKTQPPYNTVPSIASLFSANASQISTLNNNIGENVTLKTNTKVIIPVTLPSCVNIKRKWEYFWKGFAVGVAFASAIGIILICIFIRRFDPIMSSQSFKSLEIQKKVVLDNISKMDSLKVHDLKEIKANLHGDSMAMERI